MKKLSMLICIIIICISGVANARTFIDDFDDQGANNKWQIIMGNWSYVLASGTDYYYQGVGNPQAAIAADQGKSYFNDGLVISSIFNYQPSSSQDNQGIDIFFSFNDTDNGMVSYNVKIDYADHDNDGAKDYALRISISPGSENPIGFAMLTDVNSNTTFKIDITVGSDEFNVLLTDFNNGTTMANLTNLPLSLEPNITGGLVGIHTIDTVKLHSFSMSGTLTTPVFPWNIFMPPILNHKK